MVGACEHLRHDLLSFRKRPSRASPCTTQNEQMTKLDCGRPKSSVRR